jgi:hypothetical protein
MVALSASVVMIPILVKRNGVLLTRVLKSAQIPPLQTDLFAQIVWKDVHLVTMQPIVMNALLVGPGKREVHANLLVILDTISTLLSSPATFVKMTAWLVPLTLTSLPRFASLVKKTTNLLLTRIVLNTAGMKNLLITWETVSMNALLDGAQIDQTIISARYARWTIVNLVTSMRPKVGGTKSAHLVLLTSTSEKTLTLLLHQLVWPTSSVTDLSHLTEWLTWTEMKNGYVRNVTDSGTIPTLLKFADLVLTLTANGVLGTLSGMATNAWPVRLTQSTIKELRIVEENADLFSDTLTFRSLGHSISLRILVLIAALILSLGTPTSNADSVINQIALTAQLIAMEKLHVLNAMPDFPHQTLEFAWADVTISPGTTQQQAHVLPVLPTNMCLLTEQDAETAQTWQIVLSADLTMEQLSFTATLVDNLRKQLTQAQMNAARTPPLTTPILPSAAQELLLLARTSSIHIIQIHTRQLLQENVLLPI